MNTTNRSRISSCSNRAPISTARPHPSPGDVFLLIEVSDSTLLTDREEKLPIYARAGIREAWIINLPERIIEVYTSPESGAYSQTRVVRPGELLAPTAFPEVAIDTAALLGAEA